MTSRTSSTEVSFLRPFILNGFDAVQPSGTYTINTEEELMEEMSFPAWKRVATTILLKRPGVTEYRSIEPQDLHEALMRDGAQQSAVTPISITPHGRHGRTWAAMRALRKLGKKKAK